MSAVASFARDAHREMKQSGLQWGKKGDLLGCVRLHGISKELLSVPFVPFHVAGPCV